jgi:hypothetical protein
MLRTLIFGLLFVSATTLTFSKTIDIRAAIKSGLIEVEPFGNGGHTGKCIQLKLKNLKKKKLEIFVPAGLIFNSVDTFNQDLIIIQDRMLVLDKFQKRSFSLYAMCIQASNASPSIESLFETGPEAEGNLLEVIKFIDKKNIRTQAAQYAIWAVTDNKRIENINHPELAIFTAELLGKPIPQYMIQHAAQSRPGQPAFQDKPVVINGTFRYKSSEERKVSFGLYNAEGTLLYESFKDQVQQRGEHKFKFLFEVRNIPKGKYYARLISGGVVIEELEVEF